MLIQASLTQYAEKIARRVALRSFRSVKLNGAFSTVAHNSNIIRIVQLRREVDVDYGEQPYSAAKYADFSLWLLRNIHRAARLGLHEMADLRILDIGAGPGYFIAVARALGHDCYGIDVPDSYFSPLERKVYSELLDSLGCRPFVAPYAIERFVPLLTHRAKYDLVTAFLTCFNRHRQSDVWGPAEWRFFIEDVLTRLRPGGRLFVGLNDDFERYGTLKYYDAALLDYFQSVGTVDGPNVTVVKKKTVPESQAVPA